MNTTQLTDLILTNTAKAYRQIVTTQEIDDVYCEILEKEEQLLKVGKVEGEPITMQEYKFASQKALRKLIYRI